MTADQEQGPPQVVGFRLSQHYTEELSKRAQSAGLSSHAFARNCVISELESNTAEILRDLQQEMRALRSDFQAAISPDQAGS